MNIKKTKAILVLSYLMVTTSHAATDDMWGFCQNDRAFADKDFRQPQPAGDWVCTLPTADKTGDETTRNTARCLSGQQSECQLDAGGLSAQPGDHNVPRNAWYFMGGATNNFPEIRCECGCFSGEVKLLTHLGEIQIKQISKEASAIGGISLAVFDERLGRYKGSQRLFNRDFVVGPELKPILEISTEKGRKVALTTTHPVLVRDERLDNMVQARALEVGDKIVGFDNVEDVVTEIKTYQLPKENQNVYNVDTQGSSDYEHVIIANELKMGDLYWQKKLSEKSSRADNIFKSLSRISEKNQ
jgi:hypothetical protein